MEVAGEIEVRIFYCDKQLQQRKREDIKIGVPASMHESAFRAIPTITGSMELARKSKIGRLR